jgi:mono/diheme cytochrome c family protein
MTGNPARSPHTRKTAAPARQVAGAARRVSIWLFALAAALSYASSSHGADAARGRALYENHCQHCHTPKIHSRAKQLPLSKDELRLIVDDWRRQVNLTWTPEETADVVEYLNQTRYRFAPK